MTGNARRKAAPKAALLMTAAILLPGLACAQQQTGDSFMDTMGLTSQKAAQSANTSVVPVAPLKGDTTFVMSAFNATSQDKLSLFSSYDGITFTSLASETYQPPKGLLRDPSILHAADGYYYIAYTTGWSGQTFGVARSRDLKSWEHLSDVTIDLPGLTNVWAPEWFRDSDGSVSIVVSLSTGGTKGPFAAYALKATDASLTHFGPAQVMRGLENNHIDTFPIKNGNAYVVVTKNETTKTLELATAQSLFGPWTIEKTGDWAGWGDWIEGPALVPLKDGGWRIYFDDYLTKHYWYSDSTDGLKTWTPRQQLGGVSGSVRHFTVIKEATKTVETATAPKAKPAKITWDKRSLMIDGQRQMIWSGEFHMFRLPSPSLWRDILQKMKATGYNAVTLYLDWGYQTAAPGSYDFSGVRNIERVIEMAEDEGLYVIIRPGPYVNAELTMGGFPGWLARQKPLARSDNPEYLAAVDEWQTQIDAIIARHQITTGGGKVIAYQIENELGDTSDSRKRYMQHLADKVRADGITVPLFHNSAGRLPNWTPPSSTATFAVAGPTDLYSFDGYPGGGCNGTTEIGKPNMVPNWGMYGDPTPDAKGVVKVGALASPNTPGFAAEIGGGWFDFWGSPGTYDCTAKRVGSEYVRTAFGSSLINGLSIHSVYMAFGGTSWGWLPASVVYTSYDYGAGIDEARRLRSKQYTFKQQGQFVQAAEWLLSDLDKGAPIESSSPNVKLYHDVGAKGEGELIFAIHNPSNTTTKDAFSFPLKTRDGAYTVAAQLNGQDGKLFLANYSLGNQHLVYSTSELQTNLNLGGKENHSDLALLYGRAGEIGETVLRYTKAPKVEVLEGKTQSAFDAKTGDLKLSYTHNGLIRVRVSGGGKPALLLLIGDDATAQQFWRQETRVGAFLERSPALIRDAEFKDGKTLALIGDTSDSSKVEIWGNLYMTPVVTFNGAQLSLTKQADGSQVSNTIAGPDTITLPDLMAQAWQRRVDSPEANPAFDDSAWRAADLTSSAAIAATQPPAGQPVLSMSDYGFHHGDVWYRGRFTVAANEVRDHIDLNYGGGGAGMLQLWIDGHFVGQDEVPAGKARPQTTNIARFAVSALAPGAHEISVMVRNHSHNWDLSAADEHKEARGLISVSLMQSGGTAFATPIAWKIQGNKGGEEIADLVRGPMNNGGLYGERLGWYLPKGGDADKADATGSTWQAAKPDDAPPAPGTYWLRTELPLDLPKGHDVQVGLVIGDASKPQSSHVTRALIFVNGWHVGHFAANVGPQRTFVIPPGILNPNGKNTITLAVTSDGKAENALEPVKLVVLNAVRGGVPLDPVPSPANLQR